MTTPIVPYNFDPIPDDFEAHLQEQSASGGVYLTWPVTGSRLFVPLNGALAVDSWGKPSFEVLTHANSGQFKAHGFSGYSIGTYHEFLVVADNERDITFRMGGVEASFGMATPLAAFVFNAYHRPKYFGEWNQIRSVRLMGVGVDEVEAAFLNACVLHETKTGSLPRLYPIDEDLLISFWFQDEEEPGPDFVSGPPIATSIEPLRFFYSGASQADDSAACIHFYRVLEYFSFFTNATEMRRLRHDNTVSDADFSKRILDLIAREEKGPIFKLIKSLADSDIVNTASTDGLIPHPSPQNLAEEIYALRNSLVHGKFSYGYALHSDSVLEPDSNLTRWRALLRKLAMQAINQHSAKKI